MGVMSPEWEGAACTAPWDVPIRVGDDLVPEGLAGEFPFWRDILLTDHPEGNTMLTWVRDGVSVYEFLLPDARGVSVEQPFHPAVFPGGDAQPSTRGIPRVCHGGSRYPREPGLPGSIRGGAYERRSGSAESHYATSIEPSKPRLIFDARRWNATCRHVCSPWIQLVRSPPWGGRVAIKIRSMTSQISIISCYTQHRGPCLGLFGRESRMYGRCCRLVRTRAHLCAKPSPGREASSCGLEVFRRFLI